MVSRRHLLALLVAVACGAANQPSTDSSGLDSTTSADDSDADDDASTESGGLDSTTSAEDSDADDDPATSSVEDESTAGTDDQPADDRLLPLELDRSWTYDVTTFGAAPVCSPGEHTEAVLQSVDVQGRMGFEVSSFCPAAGTSVLAVDGDLADLLYRSDWIRVLDVPVEEGHTWTSTGAIEYVWRDAGTVTVPAGTFSDCWTREQIVAYTAYTTFCRGVGAVRHVSMDLAGSGWDAVLTSTNF